MYAVKYHGHDFITKLKMRLTKTAQMTILSNWATMSIFLGNIDCFLNLFRFKYFYNVASLSAILIQSLAIVVKPMPSS